MKKVLLSVGVVIIFAAYVIYQHLQTTPTVMPAISAPEKIVQTPPPSSTLPAADNSSSGQTSTAQPTTNSGAAAPSAPPSAALTPTPAPAAGQYKNGQYTGSVADAFYGNLQVEAIIQGGKLTDVQFLTYPSDRQHSAQINQQAMPILTSEAIAAQSANVNIISGATQSSQAFQQSLASALAQAQN